MFEFFYLSTHKLKHWRIDFCSCFQAIWLFHEAVLNPLNQGPIIKKERKNTYITYREALLCLPQVKRRMRTHQNLCNVWNWTNEWVWTFLLKLTSYSSLKPLFSSRLMFWKCSGNVSMRIGLKNILHVFIFTNLQDYFQNNIINIVPYILVHFDVGFFCCWILHMLFRPSETA